MLHKKTPALRRILSTLLALILCLGSVPAVCAASGYDRPGQKLLALTFDDGPGPYSDSILDTLKAHGAKATFFMNGNKVQKYAEQIRRMVAEGHQIANHTYDHPMLTKQSDAKIKDEISSTARLLTQVTGLTGTGDTGFFLRPPYGDQNQRVRAAAGVPLVYWSVDTQDWKYQSATRLVSYTGATARDGDIVLMHETHKSTAQGLGALLDDLQAKGFELVTVEELLWRRGVTVQAGQIYYYARNTGTERCERSLWFDESRLDTYWAYPAISFARDNGLMSNNESGEFLPLFPLTRAMLVTALGRLYGADPQMYSTRSFSDVPDSHYAAPYIEWAKESGVATGISEDRFAPDAPVTRQEMAVLLTRYARLFGAAAGDDPLPAYTDQASIAGWAADSVAFCSALGLLEGGADGSFAPRDTATRAMGAVVLERLSQLSRAAEDSAI